MQECSACGTILDRFQTECPRCGRATAYQKQQRRCLNCGAPVAAKAQTCLMCNHPIGQLPSQGSIFSQSLSGLAVVVLLIVGVVYGIYRDPLNGQAIALSSVLTATSTPSPTATTTAAPDGWPPTYTPTATSTAQPSLPSTETPLPTPTLRSHTILSGENPTFIADQYDISVEELLRLNRINDVTSLQVGDTLIIPYPITIEPEIEGQLSSLSFAPTPMTVGYTIESGDTLINLAFDYGISVDDILGANPDVQPEQLSIGQEIIIPLATATPTTTPTPTATATPTPGPPYPAPLLLTPPDQHRTAGTKLAFSWTSSGILAADEYYRLTLRWSDGKMSQYSTRANQQMIDQQMVPQLGEIEWQVTVFRRGETRQIVDSPRSPPSETFSLTWQEP